MKYLQESVDSVLGQTRKEFEFLILDDCSTDGSWEYLSSLNDERVILYRNESNKGLFYNLNYLITKSSGTLIKLWAQDDIMYSDCLEVISAFHLKYPETGFSYTDRTIINSEGNDITTPRIDKTPELVSSALHARIAFFTGSIAGNIANVTLSKKALDKVGLFNESMKISGDFEMWVRLAKEHPVGYIQKKLVKLRNHKEQLSGREQYYIYHLKEDISVYKILMSYVNKEQLSEGLFLLRNYKLMFYYTLMLKAFLKGKYKVAFQFFSMLSSFDNFFIVSFCYFKNRILFKKKYQQDQLDNYKLFEPVIERRYF